MNLWPNIIAKHLRDMFGKKKKKNKISHTIGNFNNCMRDNKEYVLIEKEFWESVWLHNIIIIKKCSSC